MRILLIEDEAQLREQLQRQLQADGYTVDVSADGKDGLYRASEYPLDAAIVDLGLPGLSGIEIIRQLRVLGKNLPILILTARGSWQNKVEGLEAGADDYLVKPFQMEELQARLKALLRRSSGQTPVVRLGRLAFDTVSRLPTIDSQALALTPRELAVLEALLGRIGRPVSRDALFEKIFCMEQDARPEAIEIYVSRLRKKLEGSGVVVTTVRGLGYLIDAAGEAAA